MGQYVCSHGHLHVRRIHGARCDGWRCAFGCRDLTCLRECDRIPCRLSAAWSDFPVVPKHWLSLPGSWPWTRFWESTQWVWPLTYREFQINYQMICRGFGHPRHIPSQHNLLVYLRRKCRPGTANSGRQYNQFTEVVPQRGAGGLKYWWRFRWIRDYLK